jgi:hypothetical protein
MSLLHEVLRRASKLSFSKPKPGLTGSFRSLKYALNHYGLVFRKANSCLDRFSVLHPLAKHAEELRATASYGEAQASPSKRLNRKVPYPASSPILLLRSFASMGTDLICCLVYGIVLFCRWT